MSDKKVIAVVGATGQQGGGVARAILDDPAGGFAVRALTRDPSSAAAKELAARGAEVVAADLDDEQSVRAALDGAYGAFFVTAFWEYNDTGREQAQARNMANAAKAAGLSHVVWSTLPDTRDHLDLDDERVPTLQGTYKVPHFDSKAEANRFFTESGVPTTFLSTTFYFESFLDFFAPARGADGTLRLSLPMRDRRLSGIAVADIGGVAYAILRRGTDLAGETVSVAGENLTGAEYAERFAKEFGEPVVYEPIDVDVIRASGAPGADDLANMFFYYAEHEEFFAGARDPEVVRRLHPHLRDFATWLAENRARFTF
ncbi:NmrA/HSCARG family protein [Actinophytocola sp. NPDC049390]|uniref:NmrA/HSCARG family protein n=1 Tax=Actinophytocola sp. NPDC049390 TaxID=3363894 RepID=UPI003792448F